MANLKEWPETIEVPQIWRPGNSEVWQIWRTDLETVKCGISEGLAWKHRYGKSKGQAWSPWHLKDWSRNSKVLQIGKTGLATVKCGRYERLIWKQWNVAFLKNWSWIVPQIVTLQFFQAITPYLWHFNDFRTALQIYHTSLFPCQSFRSATLQAIPPDLWHFNGFRPVVQMYHHTSLPPDLWHFNGFRPGLQMYHTSLYPKRACARGLQ